MYYTSLPRICKSVGMMHASISVASQDVDLSSLNVNLPAEPNTRCSKERRLPLQRSPPNTQPYETGSTTLPLEQPSRTISFGGPSEPKHLGWGLEGKTWLVPWPHRSVDAKTSVHPATNLCTECTSHGIEWSSTIRLRNYNVCGYSLPRSKSPRIC